MTAPVSWAASREGLAIYCAGELVAVIPFSAFGRLIYDLAAAMRG